MDITQITSEDGKGILDVVMKTFTAQVDKEYDRGRIKGTEYPEMLLGVYQMSLQQSFSFLLQKGLNDAQEANVIQTTKNLVTENEAVKLSMTKTEHEIDLLVDQLKTTELQRLLTDAETKKVIESTVLISETIISEGMRQRNLTADAELKEAGLVRVVAEGKLAMESLVQAAIKTELLNTEVTLSNIKVKSTSEELVALVTKNKILDYEVDASALKVDLLRLDVPKSEAETIKLRMTTKAIKSQIESEGVKNRLTEVQIKGETKRLISIDKDQLMQDAKLKTESAERLVVKATADKLIVEKEYLLRKIQGYDIEIQVLEKNMEKVDADIQLSIKQLDIADSEIAIKKEEIKLKAFQKIKTSAEADLLRAKAETEALQPALVAAQELVYVMQAYGFQNDASIKAAKLRNDLVALDASTTDKTVVASAAGAYDRFSPVLNFGTALQNFSLVITRLKTDQQSKADARWGMELYLASKQDQGDDFPFDNYNDWGEANLRAGLLRNGMPIDGSNPNGTIRGNPQGSSTEPGYANFNDAGGLAGDSLANRASEANSGLGGAFDPDIED